MGNLTNNFSREEFACRCGCGFDTISTELVTKLQKMRDETGTGITIESGCRCPEHNAQFGSKPEHEYGEGGDLEVLSSHHAYRLMVAAINAGFERIGFGKSPKGNLQMHVGVSKQLPTPRLWGY